MEENIKILSLEEISEELRNLSGWQFKDNAIEREIIFPSFLSGILFINLMAPYYEKHDHHADMNISYKKILFKLTRYSVGGKVTDRDIMVAREINRLFSVWDR